MCNRHCAYTALVTSVGNLLSWEVASKLARGDGKIVIDELFQEQLATTDGDGNVGHVRVIEFDHHATLFKALL